MTAANNENFTLLMQHCNATMPYLPLWEQVSPDDEVVRFTARLVRHGWNSLQPDFEVEDGFFMEVVEDLYAAKWCSNHERTSRVLSLLNPMAPKIRFDLDVLEMLIAATSAFCTSSRDHEAYDIYQDAFEPYVIYVGLNQETPYWQQFITDIAGMIISLAHHAAYHEGMLPRETSYSDELRAKITLETSKALQAATQFYERKRVSGETAIELSMEQRQLLPAPALSRTEDDNPAAPIVQSPTGATALLIRSKEENRTRLSLVKARTYYKPPSRSNRRRAPQQAHK